VLANKIKRAQACIDRLLWASLPTSFIRARVITQRVLATEVLNHANEYFDSKCTELTTLKLGFGRAQVQIPIRTKTVLIIFKSPQIIGDAAHENS
jgi:hypothetical protein